jgi:hypothetical protein
LTSPNQLTSISLVDTRVPVTSVSALSSDGNF